MKSTAEKILDAAEGLFAEKGFDATSLGDVADLVGIRSPSLYNHFRNKEALYDAVMERLLQRFSEPLQELLENEVTVEVVLQWQRRLVQLHARNPNLARLLQHAALSGGPHTRQLVERLFRPLFELGTTNIADLRAPALQRNTDLLPWIVVAFNNVVMSYVTMAPMYRDMMGAEPFSEVGTERQIECLNLLTRALFAYDPGS